MAPLLLLLLPALLSALLPHPTAAEVRVEGARSVDACLAAAGNAAAGETTVCTLASGLLEPPGPPLPSSLLAGGASPLRGPLTIRGAASGSPTTLSGALPVPSAGWRPDPTAARGAPIFVTELPKALRTTASGTLPVQVFVDDVFISEARWPNANLADMLSLDHWAVTANSSALGTIVDRAVGSTSVDGRSGLAASGIDWTGARATLNIGDRFTTYIRIVQNHSAGSDRFHYSSNLGPGPGAPTAGNVKWGGGGRYWLSGKKAALDSAGEWFLDRETHQLFLWAPDGQPPGARVSVRVKDYCVDVTGGGASAPFTLQDVAMHGCTFRLRQCDGCLVRNVTLTYPSYDPTIKIRDTPMGPPPNTTLLEGNGSKILDLHLRYANNAGLKIVGDDNVVENVLIEDVDWLGTLDFPALEVGFDQWSSAEPPGKALAPTSSSSEVVPLQQRRLRRVDDRMYPRPTKGQRNTITKATVRRFGNAGIVTSQLANEISYSHVYDGGLIGNDDACVHADNSMTCCGDPSCADNCTKEWHHNWVHDCREKCMRGDDYTFQLHGHHLVIYNCGMGPTCAEYHEGGEEGCDRNPTAGAGWLSKGDYNRLYAATIFNVTEQGQGALVATTRKVAGRSGNLANGSNAHSEFFNVVAHTVGGQGTNPANKPSPANTAVFSKVYAGTRNDASELGLVDVDGFDFRPSATSVLRGAGFVFPPYAPSVDGRPPAIGAYEAGDSDPWVPGCTLATCDSYRHQAR